MDQPALSNLLGIDLSMVTFLKYIEKIGRLYSELMKIKYGIK